jgi:hypothetical protein
MPDGFEFLNEALIGPGLLDAINSGAEAGRRSRLLARLRKQQEKARAALAEHKAEFDAVYEKALGTVSIAEIIQATAIIRQKEAAAKELLMPGITNLQEKLASPLALRNPEGRQTFHDGLRIALDWLTIYDDLIQKLVLLAAKRQEVAARTLRARPVEGEADWAELSREHIARYPKIRARLAE